MRATFGAAALCASLLLTAAPRAARAEAFVDLGASAYRVEADIAAAPQIAKTTSSGLHVGAGLRRELAQGAIGVRLELDDVDGDLLLAVRALDYARHVSERWSLGAFIGAARLDLATPAYGYYLGAGVRRNRLFGDFDLGVDLKLGDKIARDNVLPTDPQGLRPDNFYDLTGVSVYLSRRF